MGAQQAELVRWLVLTVSLVVAYCGADVHALSRRACRRACSAQLAPCAFEARRSLRRACRHAVIRACRSEGVTVCATTTSTATSTTSSSTSTTLPGCHPSYPTLCLPPPPPDLDCYQIEATNFPVLGSDPHGLDADGDGIGCEH